MSLLEKYLPFVIAAFGPALSVIMGTVRPQDYEWTLLGARYIEASAVLLVLWYVNQWLLNSEIILKTKLGQEPAIIIVNVLLIGCIGLADYLFLPLGSSAEPGWLMMARLFLVALIFNVILRIFKAKKDRSELMYINLSLQAENLRFQVDVLKQQINPHFLFNSLNTLLNLIEEDKEAATKYVQSFSNLYRTVIQRSDQDFVTLEEEMNFLREYWNLLKVRFRDVIDLKVDIPEELNHHLIPPLSLQFLIENAIKHNMASKSSPLLIEIVADGETLIIRNKLKPKEFPVNSEKVGMQNLQKRFTILHEPIVYGVVNDQYLVRIPLRGT